MPGLESLVALAFANNFLTTQPNVTQNHSYPDANTTAVVTTTERSPLTTILLGLLPIVTILTGWLLGGLIHYTLDDLVFCLAVIETPTPGGTAGIDESSEKRGLLDDQAAFSDDRNNPTSSLLQPQYITSSIWMTLRYLQKEVGDFSALRGLGTFISLSIVYLVLETVFGFLLPYMLQPLHLSSIQRPVIVILTIICMCQGTAAWLHIKISKPKHKFWFRRLPLTWLQCVQKLWMIIVVDTLIEISIDWLTSSSSSPNTDPSMSPNGKFQITDGPMTSLSILTIVYLLFRATLSSLFKPALRLVFELPLRAIDIRLTASFLPDEDDPVIPMDKSFSGRPTTGILVQEQPVSIKEATQSLLNDKPNMIRLAKLAVKIEVFQIVLLWLFFAVIFLELTWMMGPGSATVLLKMVTGTPIVVADLDGMAAIARGVVENIAEWNVNGTVAVGNATLTAAASTVAETTTPLVASLLG